VEDPTDAPYAIGFAETEFVRSRGHAAAGICLGIVGMLAGVLLGEAWVIAVSGGPLGAGLAAVRAPARLRRSIEANRRLGT
jgi:hypothetical protein